MTIVDRGSGPPLVLIPGLQGRWEYMQPAVDALARSFRVITFSLAAGDLDLLAAQVDAALDAAGVDRAVVCGVSFGGLVAVRFAATRPSRCSVLVLASTPRPVLRLRRRHQIYVKAPWIFGPVFLAESPWRMRPEIRAAIPNGAARRQFFLRVLRTLLTAPLRLSQMAARAKMIATVDVTPDCRAVTVPTLVVTGEPALDHVVPVEGSSEYLRLLANARAAVLEHTGHLGSLTRPEAFAALVRDFVEGQRDAAA